jgi:hypothetical protein
MPRPTDIASILAFGAGPILMLAALALAGCATPQERRDRAAAEIEAAAENAVAEMEAVAEDLRAEEANMTPARREERDREIEAGTRSDLDNDAAGCGTAARFSAPPYLETIVVIRADATPAQIACVQDRYPFALPAAIAEALPGALRNCELAGARLMREQERESYALNLPADIHAVHGGTPVEGRIACLTRWARERGLVLTIAESPY